MNFLLSIVMTALCCYTELQKIHYHSNVKESNTMTVNISDIEDIIAQAEYLATNAGH